MRRALSSSTPITVSVVFLLMALLAAYAVSPAPSKPAAGAGPRLVASSVQSPRLGLGQVGSLAPPAVGHAQHQTAPTGGSGTALSAPGQDPSTVNVVEILLVNSQAEPIPAGFQMPVVICNATPPSGALPYPYVVNATLYDMTNYNGSNVYFASSSGAASPNLYSDIYSWYEGTVTGPGYSCRVWWVKLPTEVPADGSTAVYMYVGGPSADYYAEFFPYVGTNAQVLRTMKYDNGQYVFVAYGYFNDTLDNWSANVYSGGFTPTPTSSGVEMTNDAGNEGTYLLPPNNWKIPLTGLIVEEVWYESSGADANVISLFGNTSKLFVAGLVGHTCSGGTPTSWNSTFVQYEYWPWACGVESGPEMYIKSNVTNKILASASFTSSAYTFYSWFMVNSTTAMAGYYEYSPSQAWAPLTLLGTLESTGMTEALLNYSPYQFPTLLIGAGTGYGISYQYVEWVVARLYPPDGVYPVVKLLQSQVTTTSTATTTVTNTTRTSTVTTTVTTTVTNTTTTTVTTTVPVTTTSTVTTTVTNTTTTTVTQTVSVTTTSTVTTTVTNTTTTTATQTVSVTSTTTVTSTATTTVTNTTTTTVTQTAHVTSTTTSTVTTTITNTMTTTVTQTVPVTTTSTVTTTVTNTTTATVTSTVNVTQTVPVTTTSTATQTSWVTSTATTTVTRTANATVTVAAPTTVTSVSPTTVTLLSTVTTTSVSTSPVTVTVTSTETAAVTVTKVVVPASAYAGVGAAAVVAAAAVALAVLSRRR